MGRKSQFEIIDFNRESSLKKQASNIPMYYWNGGIGLIKKTGAPLPLMMTTTW